MTNNPRTWILSFAECIAERKGWKSSQVYALISRGRTRFSSLFFSFSLFTPSSTRWKNYGTNPPLSHSFFFNNPCALLYDGFIFITKICELLFFWYGKFHYSSLKQSRLLYFLNFLFFFVNYTYYLPETDKKWTRRTYFLPDFFACCSYPFKYPQKNK